MDDKFVRLSDIQELKLKYAENNDIRDGWFCAMDAVMNLPAVDAIEVRHAYWKATEHKSARVCSRCEKDEPYKFADEDADVFDYCPHCGARMDG